MTGPQPRSEEHTSELQSQSNLVCRLLLEKKKKIHCHCADERRKCMNDRAHICVAGHQPGSEHTLCHLVEVTGLTPTSTFLFFFFIDTATTEIYTLSLHDALPISAFTTAIAPLHGNRSVRVNIVRVDA